MRPVLRKPIGTADIFYVLAVARIHLCCRTEPYANLLWIRDGLPYYFGEGGGAAAEKGRIAAFNRYCSNSVVHVMSQDN